MKPPVTIEDAMLDPMLLAAAYDNPLTWAGWRTVMKGAYGLPLNEPELELFNRIAGGRKPPTRKVKRCVVIVSVSAPSRAPELVTPRPRA